MPSAAFDTAAADAKAFTKKPSDAQLLELYALFKQATVGVNETVRPGFLDLAGKAKWDAWTSKKELTPAQAEAAYIAYVAELKKDFA
ncbi:hypothetical protein BGZ99_008643 [Dissophora globulifera]|uniref:ACB domain-containing protein n=1 Tax=Dissophora globulifera TaxID=979702 RepID=A0A9P6RBC3_9FUNG|nr:hypothetical protein BGZ99_008643 [Dissophora globulifera]